MFCSHCGKEASEESKYCSGSGFSTVAHKGHYIKKVNCILNTATYTKKKVAVNKKELL